MYYFEELSEFHRQRVKYLVIGGLAVNLYGIPRVTQDIDLLISFDKGNVERLMNVLKELDYQTRVPVNPMLLSDPRMRKIWIEEKNMQVFSLFHKHHNFKVVDIIISTPISYEQAEANRTTVEVQDIEIHLIGMDELIQMKKISGREQDLSDIRAIEKLKTFMGR